MILFGVVIVLSGGTTDSGERVSRRGVGVVLGLLAAAGQGAGVVIAKLGMDAVPVLQATFIRLGIGTAGLVLIALAIEGLGRSVRAWADRETLGPMVTASFLGTYLAMLLMMAGVAWAPASVAAVLLATPPIFGLAVESVVERRWPSVRGLVGTAIAVSGVAALTAA